MADFNAGSIEGTLDLDTVPFQRGLLKARADAADFERKKISARAGLDTTEFTAKKDEATVALDRLDHKKADPKVDLDISEALAKYELLKKVMNPGGLSGDGKGLFGASLSGLKITSLIAGIMGLVAAAGPASGVLAGFGVAGATAFGGIALSMGLFSAAAKSAFGEITKANKAGITLTGMAGKAQAALKGLTSEWHKLINGSQSQVMKVLSDTFHGVAGILPKLAPLLRVTAMGMDGLVRSVLSLTRQPIFERFLGSLEKFMHGFLAGAGPVLRNLLSAFMHAFIVMTPLLDGLGHGIERAAQGLEHFTAGAGLRTFLSYVSHEAPKVVALLGGVIHTLFNIGRGLAPLAGPALHFLTALVSALGALHLSPLAAGLGQVFRALTPVLDVLKNLLNHVLGPVGKFLHDLATGPIHQLATGLNKELQPGFKALTGMLNALAGPLARFAGSIANIINPTGARLLSGLLVGLEGSVKALAPALGNLLVALESLIDTGLNAIIPLLPTLTSLFGGVVKAIVPVINFLAKIISYRPVALTIIAIVAALKAWAAVQWVLNAAMDANPIGLIVIALAALVVGVVAAYQHVRIFRDILSTVFGWLKNTVVAVIDFVRGHWQLILGILTGPIGAAVIFLVSHWNAIRSGFASMIADVEHTVSSGIDNVVSWFEALPGRLTSLVGSLVNAGKSLMGAIFSGLESAASAAGGFAGNIATSIWNDLRGVLNSILPHSLPIHIGPLHKTIPLFPMLARGGVTSGPMDATIGDNPGGREAVVPLDKYDIPRRGEVASIAARADAANGRIVELLTLIAGHLAAQKGVDTQALVDGLGKVLAAHGDAQSRRMVQIARAT